jgi:c-di-GMP-binding flagellar brake protein YcgR
VKRPRINTALRLHVVGFEGELRSRVEDLYDEGTIVIANPSAAGADFTLAAGREILLEWSIKRGVAQQRAIVRDHVDVGVPGLLVEPLAEPEATQRRGFVRVDAMLPVEVERPDAGAPLRGTTLDVSGGGMRAAIPARLHDGESVRATIELPDDLCVNCVASTIRAVGTEVYAFEFEEIATADRERLIRFVFAYQRTLLQEGRLTG